MIWVALARRAAKAAVTAVAGHQLSRWVRGEVSAQRIWDRSWRRGRTRFHDPGELVDGDLRLFLAATGAGDERRGIVPEYRFRMWSDDEDAEVGWIHLRLSLTEALRRRGGHLGYAVHQPFRGRRYAARSGRLLLPLIRRHGIDPLLITCDADNAASRRTCELLGAHLAGETTIERDPGVQVDICYYHLRPGPPSPGAPAGPTLKPIDPPPPKEDGP